MSTVNMDRVARGLGVSNDEQIVDALTGSLAMFDSCHSLLTRQINVLGDALPDVVTALDRSLNALLDAVESVQAVRSSAEDHVRGEQ